MTRKIIRMASIDDMEMLWNHQKRHGKESGNNGDVIFSPFEDPWNERLDILIKDYDRKFKQKVTQKKWGRLWIITDEIKIYGALSLSHHLGLKTTLHRAILMMGIERMHRKQGYGAELIQTSLDWAKEHKTLSWVTLNVFAHNKPAIGLYEKMGFEKVGVNKDLFRVHGQSIDDMEMVRGVGL